MQVTILQMFLNVKIGKFPQAIGEYQDIYADKPKIPKTLPNCWSNRRSPMENMHLWRALINYSKCRRVKGNQMSE